MIIIIVISIMIGTFLGIALMACLSMSKSELEQKEKTKILTPGCSVTHNGLVWEIKRFMVDSENQTIAEIENRDNENHIIRRTMVPVEKLEVTE